MATELLWIGLWGGMVSLDTTAFLQIMISRPLVACTVMGMILGDVQLGFLIGMLLEPAYISELPVGAAKFSESNVGAATSAAAAILTTSRFPDRVTAVIVIVLIASVPISAAGGALVGVMRRFNTRNYTRLLDRRLISPKNVRAAHTAGLAAAFLLGFVLAAGAAGLLTIMLPALLNVLPQKYDKILQPAIGGLLAAESIFLIKMFWAQTRRRLVLLLGMAVALVIVYARML